MCHLASCYRPENASTKNDKPTPLECSSSTHTKRQSTHLKTFYFLHTFKLTSDKLTTAWRSFCRKHLWEDVQTVKHTHSASWATVSSMLAFTDEFTLIRSELKVRCWCLQEPCVTFIEFKQPGTLVKPDTKLILVLENIWMYANPSSYVYISRVKQCYFTEPYYRVANFLATVTR